MNEEYAKQLCLTVAYGDVLSAEEKRETCVGCIHGNRGGTAVSQPK